MNTAEFVTKQIAKRFTARKIPDLHHMRYCRKHTCKYLTLGYEATHADVVFNQTALYESFHRFRKHPSRYYTNDVITWKEIIDHG